MADKTVWYVMIEKNRGDYWVLEDMVPVPGDREDARRVAVDRARHHQSKKHDQRDVFRLCDDVWFAIMPGVWRDSRIQVRVVELVREPDDG